MLACAFAMCASINYLVNLVAVLLKFAATLQKTPVVSG
jgi:hypothetical protein